MSGEFVPIDFSTTLNLEQRDSLFVVADAPLYFGHLNDDFNRQTAQGLGWGWLFNAMVNQTLILDWYVIIDNNA